MIKNNQVHTTTTNFKTRKHGTHTKGTKKAKDFIFYEPAKVVKVLGEGEESILTTTTTIVGEGWGRTSSTGYPLAGMSQRLLGLSVLRARRHIASFAGH